MNSCMMRCYWPAVFAIVFLMLAGQQKSTCSDFVGYNNKLDRFDTLNSQINIYKQFFINKIDQLRAQAFEHFQRTYNKTYVSPIEFAKHARNFLKHYDLIRDWNNKYASGEVSTRLRTNHMTDWSDRELGLLNGLKIPAQSLKLSKWKQTKLGKQSRPSISWWTPRQKDWRETGCIPTVRDQGKCGSCYAFATVDMVGAMRCLESYRSEGRAAMTSLRSPQQIVDCATKDPNHGGYIYGCSGGYSSSVLEYLKDRQRLAWEAHYEYKGREGKCLSKGGGEIRKNDTKLEVVHLTSEEEFLHHIAEYGPIVASIRVNYPFYYHSDGIFDQDDCNHSLSRHAVVIVGYGEQFSGKKYWIVQNSWGEDWGEKGYFKLARGKGTCRVGEHGWGLLK